MNKRRLRLTWTCCDACHAHHRTLFAARLHWLVLAASWHAQKLRAAVWLAWRNARL